MNTFFSAGAAALLALCAPLAASAQTADPAQAAQDEAVRAYEESRYDVALAKYVEAWRLKPAGPLLLGIARSRYRLKQLDAAKSCLFDFLKNDSKSVYASEAFDLLTRIEAEHVPAGAAKPCVDPVILQPRGGDDLGDVKRPVEPPEPHHGTGGDGDVIIAGPAPRLWRWSYAPAAGGVVAAGVAAYFGFRNLSATSDWRGAQDATALAGARQHAATAARNANIAWAVSGVLIGVGTGLFFFTNF
jgi:tetratricopeptide (TPR) repeat protein